jgi:ABC-2 type transport system permease protein
MGSSINWIGATTLYSKEVRRFWKVWMQTLVAPVITTLLFLAIFHLANPKGHVIANGVDFNVFLGAGLIMMAIVQNAFANSSSSLMIGKVNGSLVDILLPPLSAGEFTTALALGAVTRGLVVGSVVMFCMAFVVPITVYHPFLALYYAFSGALMLGLLGLLTGIWAEKFDHVATITNFVVTPLSFLSGTFYSIQNLPPFWQTLAHFNPFFFMIDGLRYALTNHADGNIQTGFIVLAIVNTSLWAWSQHLIAKGYKIRT